MTIDACTRIWSGTRPWPAPRHDTPDRFDPAAYERAMQTVAAAFVLGARADRLDINVPAEHVAAFANRLPDRRLGFAPIDPLATPDPVAEIDRALDLGLAGITIAPADTGARPTHDRFIRTLEHAATRAVPVVIANPALLHPRSTLDFARHALLDEPLAALPSLRVLLSDLALLPIEETLALLAKHEHAYAEISALIGKPALLHRTLTLAHERALTHKLILGSGYPDATPAHALEDLYRANTGGSAGATTLTPPLPRAVLQDIAERNPLPLLAIDTITPRPRLDHAPSEPPASLPDRAAPRETEA